MYRALTIDRCRYREIDRGDCHKWQVVSKDQEQELEEITAGWLFTFLTMKDMKTRERNTFVIQAFKNVFTAPLIAFVVWVEFTLERFNWIVEPIERYKQHEETASPYDPPERKLMSKEVKLFWIRYLSAMGVLIGILAVLIWICATGRGF